MGSHSTPAHTAWPTAGTGPRESFAPDPARIAWYLFMWFSCFVMVGIGTAGLVIVAMQTGSGGALVFGGLAALNGLAALGFLYRSAQMAWGTMRALLKRSEQWWLLPTGVWVRRNTVRAVAVCGQSLRLRIGPPEAFGRANVAEDATSVFDRAALTGEAMTIQAKAPRAYGERLANAFGVPLVVDPALPDDHPAWLDSTDGNWTVRWSTPHPVLTVVGVLGLTVVAVVAIVGIISEGSLGHFDRANFYWAFLAAMVAAVGILRPWVRTLTIDAAGHVRFGSRMRWARNTLGAPELADGGLRFGSPEGNTADGAAGPPVLLRLPGNVARLALAHLTGATLPFAMPDAPPAAIRKLSRLRLVGLVSSLALAVFVYGYVQSRLEAEVDARLETGGYRDVMESADDRQIDYYQRRWPDSPRMAEVTAMRERNAAVAKVGEHGSFAEAVALTGKYPGDVAVRRAMHGIFEACCKRTEIAGQPLAGLTENGVVLPGRLWLSFPDFLRDIAVPPRLAASSLDTARCLLLLERPDEYHREAFEWRLTFVDITSGQPLARFVVHENDGNPLKRPGVWDAIRVDTGTSGATDD